MSFRKTIIAALLVACVLSAACLAADDEVKSASIEINLDAKGEPVNPYIYGQFIEHLGRCIYGGIWAEMLEDRKFYFPVERKYDPYKKLQKTPFPVVGASPWEIAGSPRNVKMVEKDPFVGEHAPMLQAGACIRQHDLGLVEGKKYVGYVWLKAPDGKASASVTLSHAEGEAAIKNLGNDYSKHEFTFTATESTTKATLTISAAGGAVLVGTASLMPADNVHGMRADTLKLLKELDSPVYRWPGGNFVSGYDWKDGVGPRDRRPPRKNPAWTGVEHNDFGLDEFMTFCRVLETKPLVVVNSGLGGVKMAVEELQYVNGAKDTPMGKRRAENGHPDPYGVTWWGIGNEMYGHWQLGHMPLEKYVKKHNEFAEAMRKEHSSIKIVAVGRIGKWSQAMLENCADHMDLISEHFYRKGKKDVADHVAQMPKMVADKVGFHRDARKKIKHLSEKDIDIALDEWNYWYGPYIYGELGTRYYLKDALGVAAGLNEMIRNSDIVRMANYAQTVNVIGCIKTTKTDAAFATTGLVLKLYRAEFGSIPVEASGAPKPLDVAAALTKDKKALTVAVVNPTDRMHKLSPNIKVASPGRSAKAWIITGPEPMSYNEPGEKPNVTISEKTIPDAEALKVPPYSVAIYRLPLE